MEETCSAKSRCGSIIKPRLRAEGAGETVELSLSLISNTMCLSLPKIFTPYRKSTRLGVFAWRRQVTDRQTDQFPEID